MKPKAPSSRHNGVKFEKNRIIEKEKLKNAIY